jgi:hypothetical protein
MQATTLDAAPGPARPRGLWVPSEWGRVSMPARQRRRVGPAESGGIREGPPCEGAMSGFRPLPLGRVALRRHSSTFALFEGVQWHRIWEMGTFMVK